MRALLLLALLGACADDGAADQHELIDCDGWFGFDRCERACAVKDDVAPAYCALLNETCDYGIAVDGVVGCCRTIESGALGWVPCE